MQHGHVAIYFFTHCAFKTSGATMFRCALLLWLSVTLYSTTASPYKSWVKDKDTAVQDTRYHDFNEKLELEKQVEPVEEQDLQEIDIDPHMAIWKAMKQYRQQKYNEPEEDKDKLYHPSDALPSTRNDHVKAYFEPQSYNQGQLYQEAEKDLDDVYHSIEGLVNNADFKDRVVQPEIPGPYEAEVVEVRETSVYMTPEEDKDGVYHGHFLGRVFQAPVMEDHFKLPNPPKVYTEPEEDKDHIFHS